MKKTIIFLITLMFCFSSFSFMACNKNNIKVENDSNVVLDNPTVVPGGSRINNINKVSSLSVSLRGPMLFSSGSGQAQSFIEKQIVAEVYPATALNKLVDYSVAWDSDATKKAEDVSEYIQVIPDSEGSLSAKVRCYKNFGDDKIIISATSRDGGISDTCVCNYTGLTTGLTINCGGLTLSESNERGEYHDLKIGNSYVFNLNMFDAFGTLNGDYEITVEWSGISSGKYLNVLIDSETEKIVGRYSATSESSIQLSTNDILDLTDNAGYYQNAVYLTGRNGRYPETSLFDYSFANNQLTLTPKRLVSYLETTETIKKLSTTNNSLTAEFGDFKIVKCLTTSEMAFDSSSKWNYIYDETSFPNQFSNIISLSSFNSITDLSSSYFTLKVKDKTTGVNDSIKFWISQPVTNLNLPPQIDF